MSAAPSAGVDPYLALSLDGVRLIEASAGTGKTFTLATLALRLVVERGLRIGQLLAVTFTDAATQELRRRIRERLELAAKLALALDTQAAGASPEAALTAEVLRRHLAAGDESAAQLQQRLVRAAHEIDLAAIFTIHGFCARVLSEHALDCGQPFQAPTLLANDGELLDEVATDLWRVHGADEAGAALLNALWKNPGALRDDIGPLLRAERIVPQPGDDTVQTDPGSARDAAAQALCVAWDADGADAHAAVLDAIAAKRMDGSKARAASYDKAFDTLRGGMASRAWSREDSGHLRKLLPETLRANAKPVHVDVVPASPLFDALAAWWLAEDAIAAWQAAQALRLLHAIVADARVRLARLKRQRRVQTYDDLIDRVDAALRGPSGTVLAARLREQYAVALVDEFQDTDPRQWAIFARVFGAESGAPALFLIGDPKQAIYAFRGGNVDTYLRAAAEAQPAPKLERNFRSRPVLLAAVAALYEQAGDAAFERDDIRFHPMRAGDRCADGDFVFDGAIAPALTVQPIPPPDGAEAFAADPSREMAARACVAAVHDLLVAARDGSAVIDGRALRPGDIAVLVRTHREAVLVRQALADVGIAAVAAGRQSLFETDEARELLAVLEAALQPGDEGRLRAALATVLVGLDAGAIAALDHDDARRRHWQEQAFGWRERWRRNGPQALVNDLCAANAARLLRLYDGERRLTNLLQAAEWLQDSHRHVLGAIGLVDALRRQIAQADGNDETQLLRLESDARRVQIVTLHKSKGLEYPLVFLPFAGIGKELKAPSRRCELSDGGGRTVVWKSQVGDDWDASVEQWKRARRAEDARLLYVGLTRASHALWLATGPFYKADDTPLQAMLRDPGALREVPGIAIAMPFAPRRLPMLPSEAVPTIAPARVGARLPTTDWWVHSFTQLARAEAAEDGPPPARAVVEEGAEDEPVVDAAMPAIADDGAAGGSPLDVDVRFGGTRFGVAVHDALEAVEFAPWSTWREDDHRNDIDTAPLRHVLRSNGYAEADLDDGATLLETLIGRTLTTPLPEGVRLCEVPAERRRAEMEFHFALQPVDVPALLALLHAHDVVHERRAFGFRQRLEGLVTGKIDLTYIHDGRWYVVDYKTNRLDDYDAAHLDRAMRHSEYDLQALLYTLALHRWLRFRLGDGYDYARDFGGIRYLFCRGLCADGSRGVHARTFAPDLVHALDALFAGSRA